MPSRRTEESIFTHRHARFSHPPRGVGPAKRPVYGHTGTDGDGAHGVGSSDQDKVRAESYAPRCPKQKVRAGPGQLGAEGHLWYFSAMPASLVEGQGCSVGCGGSGFGRRGLEGAGLGHLEGSEQSERNREEACTWSLEPG